MVHIEVTESLDISSFNSLRQFLAMRGTVESIHSDCGTNFVGACKELKHKQHRGQNLPLRTGMIMDFQAFTLLSFCWGMGEDGGLGQENS